MSFSISKATAWIKTKIDLENSAPESDAQGLSLDAIDFELKAMANPGGGYSDDYITRDELRHKKSLSQHQIRPITSTLVKSYLDHRMVRRDDVIYDLNGFDVLEELVVYDDSDEHFDLKAKRHSQHIQNQQTDLILRKSVSAGGEVTFKNISNEVLKRAEDILKFIYTYDAAADQFTTLESSWELDAIFTRIASGERIEWNAQQQKSWDEFKPMDHINIHLLLLLYRMHRVAEHCGTEGNRRKAFESAVSHSDLRRIIDAATGVSRRNFGPIHLSHHRNEKSWNQHQYVFENKFVSEATEAMIRLSTEIDSEQDESISNLSLAILSNNHLFDMTDGEFGLELYKSISENQWQAILSDTELTRSIHTTLSNSVYVHSLTFFRDLLGEDKSLRLQLIESILLNPAVPTTLQVITASALALGMRNQLENFDVSLDEFTELKSYRSRTDSAQNIKSFSQAIGVNSSEFTIGDLILHYMNKIHTDHASEGVYPSSALVEIALQTFGILSNKKKLSSQFRNGAFDWCVRFSEQFTTFTSAESTKEELADQKSSDRVLIIENQKVMTCLDSTKSQEHLFDASIKPLNYEYDPRRQKQFAHNDYYSRVGKAQYLAQSAGQDSLAFKRRLDQENNEWGRDFERKVREDAIFRLDVLSEARASIESNDETSVEKIISLYDPDGILQRNLGLIHLLRHFFQNNSTFNPLNAPVFERIGLQKVFHGNQTTSIDNLNIPTLLATTYSPQLYSRSAEFDTWLIQLQRNNPEFITELSAKLLSFIEESRRLSFEVFFLEVNEVETFQYLIDPVDGPETLFDFVGKIRSWTSGYQGRLLTRMQIYFDQEAIVRSRLDPAAPDLRAEDFRSHYVNSLGEVRFDDPEYGIVRYLIAAETPPIPKSYQITEDEVFQILKYFTSTGFAAYIPDWLFFIINHRFIDDNGVENFMPATLAFEALETTRFPKSQMEDLFRQNGYLNQDQPSSARQHFLQQQAALCLKQLPRATPKNQRYSPPEFAVRSPINFASKRTNHPSPRRLEKLIRKMDATVQVTPGQYFDYREQARALIKTHKKEAVLTIIDEALHDAHVEFNPKTPLSPLFPGLIGDFVSYDLLQSSIEQIATDSSATKRGITSMFNFSGILVRWADRNHIDLNETFSDAFDQYQVPENIRLIQEDIDSISRQISSLESRLLTLESQLKRNQETLAEPDMNQFLPILDEDKQIEREMSDLKDNLYSKEGLLHRKSRLEFERNQEIAALENSSDTFSDQALMQVLTHVYNAVRKQYLKEILISDGDVTAEIIEDYLEQELIPEYMKLSSQQRSINRTDLGELEDKIEFLTDILSDIEGSEYLNDYSTIHTDKDKYRRQL